MIGNVLHFISVDKNGEEVRDKGIVKDVKVDENNDTYLIIESQLKGIEVDVLPEMVTSLY